MPQQMDDELLQQAQAGEESAIAALITAMMPAIRKGAAAVAAPGLDFDDAVQEGLIGLFHAVRSYRADKKSPLPRMPQPVLPTHSRMPAAVPPAKACSAEQQCAPAGKFCRAGAGRACHCQRALRRRAGTHQHAAFAPGTRQSACQFGGAHRRPDSPTAALHPQSGGKRPDARPQKAAQ